MRYEFTVFSCLMPTIHFPQNRSKIILPCEKTLNNYHCPKTKIK